MKHLKKHGNDVYTDVIAASDDEALIEEYATLFSKVHFVVEADRWANLRIENGQDGAPVGHDGHVFTPEQLEKISAASKANWQDPDFQAKVKASQSAAWTNDRKAEQAERSKNAWTLERRAAHSARLKQLYEEEPERRARMAAKLKGRKMTEEHKHKISQALKKEGK